MGAAVGHEVLELVRVRIGRLGLGTLAPGKWRELTAARKCPSSPGRSAGSAAANTRQPGHDRV